jgi:hypothetical protein
MPTIDGHDTTATNETFDLTAWAQTLTEALPDLARDTALSLTLLRALAVGEPVAHASLAAALDQTEEQVAYSLTRFTNIERDEAGRIVAAVGLSLRPTPHQFMVAGHALYTWCALDTLIFPAALSETAQVSSPCPVSGAHIQLTVTPDAVERLEPSEAAVSLLIPDTEAACCDVRGAFCDVVNFFASRADAAVCVQGCVGIGDSPRLCWGRGGGR